MLAQLPPSTPRSSSPASSDEQPPGALCVYYDGGCPLCRAEIATYQRADSISALRWVDADGCAPTDLGTGLERPAALARLHVRRADGTLLHGAAGFVEIWAVLPRWKWLARVARLPAVMPLLELGYRGFLRLRPLWRPARGGVDRLPRPLLQELRTDHAGETGAVMIYRGVLAVTRDPALREFAHHHLETELRHLALIEQVVAQRWRSRLLPFWRLSGWLTGALPACLGPRTVYATIQAVETFVDRHYASQCDLIDACVTHLPADGAEAAADVDTRAALLSVRALLEQCRLDEVAHRDDASARWDGRAGAALAAWRFLVGTGSYAAVGLCRHL